MAVHPVRGVSMTEGWLLERAVAMLAVLVTERDRSARTLVRLPPEGATLHEIERAALVAALDRTGWVQVHAATLLGMSARVMHYKMARFNLYRDNPHGTTAKRQKRPGNPFGRANKPTPRKAGDDWRLRAADIS